jgi:PEP-CTERM motif
MTKFIHIPMLLRAAFVCLAITATANATPLILNGGFEAGFASRTRVDQLGSEGTFSLQTGTLSPVSGGTVPAPPQGVTAAMTDGLGPGAHLLYQDFLVPAESALLTFSLFIGNRANVFATPPTLDFSTPALNQRARVDIVRPGLDPFTLAPADIVLNLYQTQVGGPLITGYTDFSFDLTSLFAANVGQTLRLRFAETDNINTFQFGVDNVSLETGAATVPEPGSTLLLCSGLLALLTFRHRIAQG